MSLPLQSVILDLCVQLRFSGPQYDLLMPRATATEEEAAATLPPGLCSPAKDPEAHVLLAFIQYPKMH